MCSLKVDQKTAALGNVRSSRATSVPDIFIRQYYSSLPVYFAGRIYFFFFDQYLYQLYIILLVLRDTLSKGKWYDRI